MADGIPDGDSNADLHALLAFSKKRLDTAKQPPDGESQRDGATQEEAETKEQQDENTDTDDVAAAAAPAETAQDVPEETENAATNASDDNEGSNAAASEAKTKAEDDEGTDTAAAAAKTDGMSSKEAAAKASQADDSQKELWALLSYSKQRLETGAHAGGQKKEKKKSSSRKKRSSSMGTAGSMKSPLTSPTASPARRPKKSDAAAAAEGDMEELQLDGGGGGENEKKANADAGDDDDDGHHSRESVASEGSDGERMDSDEEEYSNEDAEELSSDEEDSEDSEEEDSEDSHDDSRGGIPATPSFLRQLEETDKEGPDSTDAKIMSDAARSYADAILSVADEKGTGDLTEKQMLEAMSVAEAAAAAGEERFTTSIAQLRLHEAKVASKKMAMSMKAEVDKAAKSAKTVKDRQVARQNKLFSGKRPAGKWITGKVKEFQETCAKVDGPP